MPIVACFCRLRQKVTTYQEQIKGLKISAKNTQKELHTLKHEKINLEQANTTLT
ncbi:hypothetical protein NHP20013_13010 [Helicobacter bizzozeronii]|uniref:hypothetical protein n=1 Tax=Helicobacter bizzozeronii TaxID=56877 RepID=UPI001315394B|nr:hypothetical protein [Helicobacter bizzozeronii]GMT39176.1 hypothetical protein NHP20013_13010 [Helicobacter bizzozeronii]